MLPLCTVTFVGLLFVAIAHNTLASPTFTANKRQSSSSSSSSSTTLANGLPITQAYVVPDLADAKRLNAGQFSANAFVSQVPHAQFVTSCTQALDAFEPTGATRLCRYMWIAYDVPSTTNVNTPFVYGVELSCVQTNAVRGNDGYAARYLYCYADPFNPFNKQEITSGNFVIVRDVTTSVIASLGWTLNSAQTQAASVAAQIGSAGSGGGGGGGKDGYGMTGSTGGGTGLSGGQDVYGYAGNGGGSSTTGGNGKSGGANGVKDVYGGGSGSTSGIPPSSGGNGVKDGYGNGGGSTSSTSTTPFSSGGNGNGVKDVYGSGGSSTSGTSTTNGGGKDGYGKRGSKAR